MQKLCVCWTWKKVKVFQLYPTLCDPTHYTVHGILQARILEWVGIPFPRGSSQPRDWTQVSCIADRHFSIWATSCKNLVKTIVQCSSVQSLSRVWLFATPWTVACQPPLSMGFSREEYWGGLPFPSPGDLPNPGIKPVSPALQAYALSSVLEYDIYLSLSDSLHCV